MLSSSKRGGVVLRHALPVVVHDAERDLRVGIALLGQGPQDLVGAGIVAGEVGGLAVLQRIGAKRAGGQDEGDGHRGVRQARGRRKPEVRAGPQRARPAAWSPVCGWIAHMPAAPSATLDKLLDVKELEMLFNLYSHS